MPISQSVKHQSNVLDRKSCDKLEHLPIKKRRFLLRSPSPPKIPPISEEDSKLNGSQEDLPQPSEFDAMPVDKVDVLVNCPSKVNEPIKCSEDFSGISMLAAAACSSMVGKESGSAQDGSGIEEPSAHEGPVDVSTNSEALSLSKGMVKEECVNTFDTSTGVTSSCETTVLAGELTATPAADFTPEKVGNVENCVKEPSHEDGTPNISSDVSSMRDDDLAGSRNLQCQDHRLHWDLNVVMDAWDQPFHDQNNQASDHVLQNELESPACEVGKKLLHYDSRKSLDRISEGNARICADKCNDIVMSVKSETMNVQSSLGNANLSVQPSYFERVNEKLPVSTHAAANEPTGETRKFDPSAPLFIDQTNPPVPDRTRAAVSDNTSVSVIDTQEGLTLRPCLQIENELTLKSIMPDKPFDDRRGSLKDDNSAHIYMTSELNNGSMLEKVKKENDHPGSTPSLQELTVTPGTKANNDKFLMNNSGKLEADFHISTKEVQIASAKHFEEKFISDTAIEPCSTHETGAGSKLQDDNDSQYEDGELREPSRNLWEEYGAVNEKPEPVVYVCDKSIYSVTAADHLDSELGQIKRIKHEEAGHGDVISSCGVAIVQDPEIGRPIADDNVYGKDENVTKLVHSGDEKMKGPAASSEMLDSSNRLSLGAVVRVGDDNEGKGRIYNLATRPPDLEDNNTRIGSRLYGRALLPENEGPCGPDRPFREDQTVNRSKLDGVAARWDRGSTYMKSESVRYPMQSQPRAHPTNNWHGSPDIRRGIKRNFSPTYNAHANKLGEGEDTVVAKEDRDGASYLSHPPSNDESIADPSSAAGNFQPNLKLHGGGLGTDRLVNRGRFIRYGRQIDHGSAGRGRYNGPSPDDSFQPSMKYRRGPLPQRDGSFSPNERSRSPDTRVFTRRVSPRGRSAGGGDSGGAPYVRYKSRSPNFRSEGRTPRMRSPPSHQRFGGGDRMTGFRPFQRDQGSPPSRWINRKDDPGPPPTFKQQRPMLDESPNRNRMRGERTDHLEFVRNPNPKPDVCFRQNNNGRFSDMEPTNNRPQRLEENYENRRRQFGPINTARRGGGGYEDGVPKRLHSGDDGFVPMNRDVGEFHGRGNRDIDNRNGDMPRKFRRDGNFMYDRDGKFGSNSKQFGYMKSGEPYRSVNPGRFNEMDGAGRGQRYMDRQDDRRRPFSTVYLPRRGEMEGIGRRPSHEVDDNNNNPGRRLNHDVDNLPGRQIRHEVDDNLQGRRISQGVDDNLPVPNSCNDDATDSHGRNQREEQSLDLSSGQEKKVGEISNNTTDVEAPGEK